MRTAVLGLGEAGFTIHLPALTGMTGVDVVGAADPEPARRARAAAAFRTPVFESLGELLVAAQPEVVIVATPPHTHGEYCLQALASGAHVVCEKPFASSVNEGRDLIAAAAAAGRQIAVNHQFRHMPIFRALCSEAQRTPVTFAQMWQLMNAPPASERGWRGQLAQRTLYEAGVHLIDYAMALFGGAPEAVRATMAGTAANATADAIVLATLEFSGGRLAHVTQNRVCRGPMQYFEVRAETGEASLRASFGGRSRISAGFYRSTRPHVRVDYGASGLAWKEIGPKRMVIARNPSSPMVAATRAVLTATFAAFRSGAEPPTSAADACRGLEVIAACYHSAASGSRVVLDGSDAVAVRARRMGVATGSTAD
jgi:predicted dehydrogenase